MRTNGNDPVNGSEERTSPYHEMPPTTMVGGLTKREHFAAVAMNAIISNPHTTEKIERLAKDADVTLKVTALIATQYADALIDALNSGLPNEG